MTDNNDFTIGEEIISKIGLRRSEKQINAQIAPEARVFDYPGLDDVFVMESDLYGNKMPKGSCFLAFNGQHGLIGKPMKLAILQHCSRDDIKHMVEDNCHG
jgi:hypothetical protein